MCNLCVYPATGKVDNGALWHCQRVAASLKHLALQYEGFSTGSIKPHTDESATVGVEARLLIRDLVEDWL